MTTPPRDPFRNCDIGCHHDLAAGILVSDLLEHDGPHPPLELVWRREGRAWVRRRDRRPSRAAV